MKQDIPTRDDFQDHATAVRPGEELNLAKLDPFLRRHFPEEAGPLTVQQFPSGHSNLTYFVSLGEREMVLRRPPFGSKVKSAHDMGREYRVLSKLHSVYPAPRALQHCNDLSILEAPFYLMERIPGVILRREPPEGLEISPSIATRLSETFIDRLADLHGVDYAAIGLADLGRPEGYMERQIKGWIERYHGSKTHELPDVETISSWLTKNIPAQSGAALIHNDYKFDNIVLDAADITQVKGVLDWEMCTIGDPLADLGTAVAYWIQADDPPELQSVHWGPTTAPGSLTRRQIIERYAARTGRDVANMVFYYVFALFKTGVIVQQIYYRYHHGLTQDRRFASLLEVNKTLLKTAVKAIERNTF